MQIVVTMRHLQAPTHIRGYAEEKIKKLHRFITKPISCHIILSQENNCIITEIKLTVKHKQIFVKESSEDIIKSIDGAYEKIVSRVKKFNELRQAH